MKKALYIVYPSARPSQVLDAVRRLIETSTSSMFLSIALAGETDLSIESFKFAGDRLQVALIKCGPYGERTLVQDTNTGYRQLVESFAVPLNALVGYWSDDFYPESGWDVALFSTADKRPRAKFFQCNDGLGPQPSNVTEFNGTVPFAFYHWWRDHNGNCMFPPIYTRYYCDVDIATRAHRQGVYVYADRVRIIHRAWHAGHREMDDVDKSSFVTGSWDTHPDKYVFDLQKQNGWKVTW